MPTAFVSPAPPDAGARDKSASHWRYTRQAGKALTKNGQRLSGLSRIWSDADRLVIDAQRPAQLAHRAPPITGGLPSMRSVPPCAPSKSKCEYIR